MVVFDFYYSEKQNDVQETRAKKNGIRYVVSLFDGGQWTEHTRAGWKMSSAWDDYVLIGTGTLDRCRYEYADQSADDT